VKIIVITIKGNREIVKSRFCFEVALWDDEDSALRCAFVIMRRVSFLDGQLCLREAPLL
jgi:hypothetical protein